MEKDVENQLKLRVYASLFHRKRTKKVINLLNLHQNSIVWKTAEVC